MDGKEIAAALGGYQFSYTCEDELQRAIASALTDCSIPHQREHWLNPKDRLDFLVGSVAIEVKVKGSLTEVARQVSRYLEAPELTGIVVVTTKTNHRNLPESMSGKPIYVLYLPQL